MGLNKRLECGYVHLNGELRRKADYVRIRLENTWKVLVNLPDGLAQSAAIRGFRPKLAGQYQPWMGALVIKQKVGQQVARAGCVGQCQLFPLVSNRKRSQQSCLIERVGSSFLKW